MATFGRSARWNGSENLVATKNPAAIQKSENQVAAKKPAASQKSTVGQLFQRPPLRQPNRALAPKVSSKTDDVATLSQSFQKASISDEKAKVQPAITTSYSASLLPPGVPDIDAADSHEPQLCSEYAQDIFDYMASLEVRWPVQPNFLRLQPSVTPEMRSILVNWLMQVHSRFQLLPETLFLTVSLVDRFLQEQSVSRSKLQLVGVSALFTAGKYEEMMAPTLGDVVYVTDGAYQGREVMRMEQQILRALDWSLGRPLPLHFLRRNSKAAQADVQEHSVAKYALELSLLDYSMSWVRPSEQAAAALCLALNLLGKNKKWGTLMTHYGRYSEQDLQPTMQRMAALLLDAPKSAHKAPYEKYKSSRLESVSTLMATHTTKLRKMAGRT
ncbi:G2/mitotic-specific cyclin-B2-like [Amblyomma americanum]|uniref:Cyclin b n=1 Tax=Amblyomma americanum TaxID=6943 RepID=A0AAQ4EB07_AMBAM